MSDRDLIETDVLVVGGGFAGTACARRLERRLPSELRITLICSENHFVFQPLLPEVVGANLEPSHAVVPLRHMLRRTTIVRGEVERLEVATPDARSAGTLVTSFGEGDEPAVFSARHIVFALGSVTDPSRISGMAEHALPLKTVADAVSLRRQVIEMLERAVTARDPELRRALLTFAVVGGGFSGIETAAELNDLVRSLLRFFPALAPDEPRVLVVHGQASVLPELPASLRAYSEKLLRRRGVQFRLEARTRAVSHEAVYLEDGERIPARTVVCTVGNAPHPLVRELSQRSDGRLTTDEFMRVSGRERLWAIGDCAHAPDGHGGVCPPTAQFASRQGDRAADNIAAAFAGRTMRAFRHRSLGQLATLGHRRAVAAIGPLRLSGFAAWWLWRTIYLSKLPRLDRKLRVVLEWTQRLFFPRDLFSLREAPENGHRSIHLEVGETLFRQGDPSRTFFVIESGQVRLTRVDADGRPLGRDLLGPGDHFGEGSLLHRGERTTTAVATEATTVLAFPARQFETLTGNFRALRELLERTSRRFRPGDVVMPSWLRREQLERPLAEIMTEDVAVIAPDASLASALGLMFDRGIRALPLVGADDRLRGLVTSSDVFTALRRNLDLDVSVDRLASSHVRCLRPDATVGDAIEIMRRHDLKHVVVTDEREAVVGIVSIKDALRDGFGKDDGRTGVDGPSPAAAEVDEGVAGGPSP